MILVVILSASPLKVGWPWLLKATALHALPILLTPILLAFAAQLEDELDIEAIPNDHNLDAANITADPDPQLDFNPSRLSVKDVNADTRATPDSIRDSVVAVPAVLARGAEPDPVAAAQQVRASDGGAREHQVRGGGRAQRQRVHLGPLRAAQGGADVAGTALDFNAKATQLVVGDAGGQVLWDVMHKKEPKKVKDAHTAPVVFAAFYRLLPWASGARAARLGRTTGQSRRSTAQRQRPLPTLSRNRNRCRARARRRQVSQACIVLPCRF